MNQATIISRLPYSEPFLFVDEITDISENGITGYYKFSENAHFYEGHFKGNPVTPGVILTECMTQIGLVCLGIYLLEKEPGETRKTPPAIALTSTEVEFYKPVFPGEKVKVVSEKIYFRFQKLKCKIKMYNSRNSLICQGSIAGMITSEI